MPQIIEIITVDFGHNTGQEFAKEFAKNMFSETIPGIEKKLEAFDNAKIKRRNFCVPVEFFARDYSFEEKNRLFQEISLEHSVNAIEDCLTNAGFTKEELTDIIYVNTTGLATPSMDAMIINKMRLNKNINRLPIWGLGCAGGVSGIGKAMMIAKANPGAVIMLICVELCTLTFRRNDLSKSNFIATSLFSDGICACLIAGDEVIKRIPRQIKKNEIISSRSRLYYDSHDVMGWDFLNEGFKVVFSRDIPNIIHENVKQDIEDYLKLEGLGINDITNFIAHPGGAKVIQAYIDALALNPAMMTNTQEVLSSYGNMSSVSVLYVLNEFFRNGFKDGYGLMISLGPGFSSEMALLKISNF